MSGSVETQREISPLMTAESSTTITRNGSCRIEVGGGELINATVIIHPVRQKAALLKRYAEGRSAAGSKKSEKADFLELRRDDVLVEGLHDVFVGASMKRARDVRDVVFSGAEHHLGLVSAGHAAQIAEEFIAVHHGHVPVEQDRLGHGTLADFERFRAVLGFHDLEIKTFQDTACNLANDA